MPKSMETIKDELTEKIEKILKENGMNLIDVPKKIELETFTPMIKEMLDVGPVYLYFSRITTQRDSTPWINQNYSTDPDAGYKYFQMIELKPETIAKDYGKKGIKDTEKVMRMVFQHEDIGEGYHNFEMPMPLEPIYGVLKDKGSVMGVYIAASQSRLSPELEMLVISKEKLHEQQAIVR